MDNQDNILIFAPYLYKRTKLFATKIRITTSSSKQYQGKMTLTKTLKEMNLGETREIKFVSPQELHSYRSTIAYVNRMYMKPNGKIIRGKFSYNLLYGKIKCMTFVIPEKAEEIYP